MRKISLVGYWALVGLVPLGASAAGPMCAAKQQAAWTGTLTTVNVENHTITAKSFWHTRTFNVGDTCGIWTLDKQKAALSDLRPGEKASIRYEKAGGVLIAGHISIQPLRVTGTLQSLDPQTRTVTLEEPLRNRTFKLAGDCTIVLWNEKAGTLADLTPGNRIVVTYELPGGSPVGYRIREQTQMFTGKVYAIDLTDHTVKVGELMGNKRFNLADGCRVMVNSKPNGNLSDLQLGHTYRFTYENVDGVNVADRIAPATENTTTTTASIK